MKCNGVVVESPASDTKYGRLRNLAQSAEWSYEEDCRLVDLVKAADPDARREFPGRVPDDLIGRWKHLQLRIRMTPVANRSEEENEWSLVLCDSCFGTNYTAAMDAKLCTFG